MKKKSILLVTALSLPFAGLALAQTPAKAPAATTAKAPVKDDLDALVALARKDTLAHKSDIVAKNMTLDAGQAAAFWPLYKAYEAERKIAGDERYAIIQDFAEHFASMNDAKAKGLSDRFLAAEDKRIATEKKYYAEMSKVLPGKVVARFFQIDRRLNMLIDLTLSSQLPLVQ
jgi:hypothetical protein